MARVFFLPDSSDVDSGFFPLRLIDDAYTIYELKRN